MSDSLWPYGLYPIQDPENPDEYGLEETDDWDQSGDACAEILRENDSKSGYKQ